MPAESKAQRRFFGMLEHNPGMAEKKGIHMSKDEMHKMASTSEKGLPEHAKKTVHHSPTMTEVDCHKLHQCDGSPMDHAKKG